MDAIGTRGRRHGYEVQREERELGGGGEGEGGTTIYGETGLIIDRLREKARC